MKFRGRIHDPQSIRQFHALLSTLAKLGKVCVLRLTKDTLYFILLESGSSVSSLAPGGPAVWADVPQAHLFHDYQMEGVTQEENEIYLELEPDRLAKTLGALKSGQSARALKIKLTRKHDSPCLSFEIDLSSQLGVHAKRHCTHDVPVKLIPRRLWADYREPALPAFDVSVYLPEMRVLKQLTERYKNLGHHFTLQASRSGQLRLSLESDHVDVVTHLKNLDVPAFGDVASQRRGGGTATPIRPNDDVDDEEFVSVRVDLRRLNMFLSAEQVQPKRVIANLVAGRMVHLMLVHDEVCLQYFVPAVCE